MKTWLISDWHFHHANLVRGGRIGTRPFDTVEEMNEHIIERHNAVVRDGDRVICLGDVTLERDNAAMLDILKRLAGRFDTLLLGNHDHFPIGEYEWFFEHVRATMKLGGTLLSHVPIHPSQFYRFKGNIHGHTHEKHVMSGVWAYDPTEDEWWERQDSRYLNVCVEALDYTPIELDDAIAKLRP